VVLLSGFLLWRHFPRRASGIQDISGIQDASRFYVMKRDGMTLYVSENSSFKVAEMWNEKGSYDLILLRSLQHNEQTFDAEGTRGWLRVSAQMMRSGHPEEQLWSFQTVGNEGDPIPSLGLYQATSWPCCSAMWVHEYFSLLNGKHLYTTNGCTECMPGRVDGGLLDLNEYDGRSTRGTEFVAFGASYEKGHEEPVLQFGTDREVKQRFVLKGHEYGDSFDVPEIKLLNDKGNPFGNQNVIDGAVNFTIVLKFQLAQEPEAELRIPVIKDVVRPDLAKLPEGYSLTAVAPPQ
jgi:hypothetical protein